LKDSLLLAALDFLLLDFSDFFPDFSELLLDPDWDLSSSMLGCLTRCLKTMGWVRSARFSASSGEDWMWVLVVV